MNKRSFFSRLASTLGAIYFWRLNVIANNPADALKIPWVRYRPKPGQGLNRHHDTPLEWEKYYGECPYRETMDIEEIIPRLCKRGLMEFDEFPGGGLVRFKERQNPVIMTYRMDNQSHTCFLVKTEIDNSYNAPKF